MKQNNELSSATFVYMQLTYWEHTRIAIWCAKNASVSQVETVQILSETANNDHICTFPRAHARKQTPLYRQ